MPGRFQRLCGIALKLRFLKTVRFACRTPFVFSILALVKAMGIDHVRIVDPYDLKQCDEVIKEELAANEPSVIISRRPCALLKYVKHNKPVVIDNAKCVGCKACMKIGCPAISIIDGKAKVDATQCVGCGVCEQLCKLGALKEV